MSVPAADATPRSSGQQLPAGVWIAAAVEVVVALAVGVILLHSGDPPPSEARSMPDMVGMPSSHHAAQIHWTAGNTAIVAFTGAMLVWWAFSRARVPAVLAAVGLVGVAVSDPIRTMSLQSHLVAMTALEALLVAAPLLVIAALRWEQAPVGIRRSGLWTAGVVIAVLLNSVFLIALHLPGIHGRGAHFTAVPLWVTGVAIVVGFAFWAPILVSGGHVAQTVRRGALIVGQEVAVILGLAALFVPSPHMHEPSPLGLSATLDQRLGGALMVLTCAAVTLPLIKRLDNQHANQELRTEPHVH